MMYNTMASYDTTTYSNYGSTSNVIYLRSPYTTTTTWYERSPAYYPRHRDVDRGSATTLPKAVETLKSKTGTDLSRLLKTPSFDRKELAALLDKLLWEEQQRQKVQVALRRQCTWRRRPSPRAVLRRARSCGASSTRTATPAHAFCPR